jgi:hypothetical protein
MCHTCNKVGNAHYSSTNHVNKNIKIDPCIVEDLTEIQADGRNTEKAKGITIKK